MRLRQSPAGDAAAAGHPADAWRNRTIYQVLTDRFDSPARASCNNLQGYCGGTFNAIAGQLDYITGMGFDALWISPVVENTDHYGDATHAGYHGYWARDLFAINPNFGTADDLRALVAACHARGVWVMLDVVANHMGYDHDVTKLLPFSDPADYHDCARAGCPQAGNPSAQQYCYIDDFQTNQMQVQLCRLAGLPDLNQTRASVAAQLTAWVRGIVANYSFDGIRVDTVEEVNKPFWGSFNKAAGCYAVGEVNDGRVAYVGSYQSASPGAPGLDATLSYPLFFTLRSVFGIAGGSGTQPASMLELQTAMQNYDASFADTGLLGTFIDNHDNPRFLSAQRDLARYRAALAFVLLSRGIPIVYYGTAAGYDGANDPYCRAPLWGPPDAGYSIYGSRYGAFSTQTPLYAFLRTVVGARKAQRVWEHTQVQRYADASFYAFSRGTTLVALTNVGTGGAQQERTIECDDGVFSVGDVLCNVFYPEKDCITVKRGESPNGEMAVLHVYLDGGETKIYTPKQQRAKQLAPPPPQAKAPPAPATKRSLPAGSLIVGYATACDDANGATAKVLAEAEAGVNVIIWFASNLVKDATTGAARVAFGMNVTCIANVAATLRARRLPTAHLLSVGGWDAPHPNTSFSGAAWFEAWHAWNTGPAVSRPSLGWHGFDGIDWDLEGNDNVNSTWNHFTTAGMALVGDMSVAAKRAGYVVTLVPPQSYFDVTRSAFDLSLLHGYPDFHPKFKYHGHNAYVLWYAKYGGGATFDFIDVQLYESFSPANEAIYGQNTPPAEYLVGLARAFSKGWTVDFGSDPAVKWPTQVVRVPPSQLVLGFSFGWSQGKSLFVDPKDFAKAWAALSPAERPRGGMFWNIGMDGGKVNHTSNVSCNFAKEFNEFMHVRGGK